MLTSFKQILTNWTCYTVYKRYLEYARKSYCLKLVAHWEHELSSLLCPPLSLTTLKFLGKAGHTQSTAHTPALTLMAPGGPDAGDVIWWVVPRLFHIFKVDGNFCLEQNVKIIFLTSSFSFSQIKILRKYREIYFIEKERLKMRTPLGSQKNSNGFR